MVNRFIEYLTTQAKKFAMKFLKNIKDVNEIKGILRKKKVKIIKLFAHQVFMMLKHKSNLIIKLTNSFLNIHDQHSFNN